MNNNIRSIKSIISRIDKRNDIEQIRVSLYSILTTIILSKQIFKRNEDIKLLLEELNLEYKDYVYKNRTLIVAKVIRHVQKADSGELHLYIDVCKNLLFPDLNKKIDAPTKGNNSIDELLRQFKRG